MLLLLLLLLVSVDERCWMACMVGLDGWRPAFAPSSFSFLSSLTSLSPLLHLPPFRLSLGLATRHLLYKRREFHYQGSTPAIKQQQQILPTFTIPLYA